MWQPQLSGSHCDYIPMGSFSQDPIGFAAGDANLYRYVGNGPVDSTDPSGLQEGYLPRSGMDFYIDRLAAAEAKRQLALWQTIINDAKRRGLPTKILEDAMQSGVRIGARQSGAAYQASGMITCGFIGLPNDTIQNIISGTILRTELMLIYNEAFHAWMQNVGYSVPWLVQLMQAEGLPLSPTWIDRLSSYDKGLDMADEAMSESIAGFLFQLDPNIGGKRRSADLNKICSAPGHSDRGEKWYGIEGAERPISHELGIALIWLLENGGATPPEFGLQEWFNRRWSPNRPDLPRVDQKGNPR